MGPRPGTEISYTASVEVIATSFSTISRNVACTSSEFISRSRYALRKPAGHSSGCFPGWYSLFASSPCSTLSIPAATASRYPTEHKCAVTLIPCLCASSIAAARSSRLIQVYALNQLTPSSAQYRTTRRADSGPSRCIICVAPCSPVRYGPVVNMFGPIFRPASMSRLRLSSSYGARAPVVRIVVTPEARYSLDPEKDSCAARPFPPV